LIILAFLAHRLVETGIDDDRAGRPDDRPDKKIKRLQNVVWIIVDEIRRRMARMVAVTDGVNFVNILGHDAHLNLPAGRLREAALP